MANVPVSQINSIEGRKIPGTNQFIDIYLVAQFLKRIMMPFDKWPAYQAGIIDEKGKVLKQRNKLSSQDKRAWGYYDIAMCNLKKILQRVPGGNTNVGKLAAAYFLFKEQKKIDCSNEMKLYEEFFKQWNMSLREEVGASVLAANNMGGGKIADPQNKPLGKPRKKSIVQILKRKPVI